MSVHLQSYVRDVYVLSRCSAQIALPVHALIQKYFLRGQSNERHLRQSITAGSVRAQRSKLEKAKLHDDHFRRPIYSV